MLGDLTTECPRCGKDVPIRTNGVNNVIAFSRHGGVKNILCGTSDVTVSAAWRTEIFVRLDEINTLASQ